MKLFEELKRRNVFRVAGVYAVAGWLLAQAAGVLENSLNMPGWFDTVIVSALLLGLPVALILAWAFEMTPDGMKLTANVPEGTSVAPKTGRKLDYAILGGIALIAVMFVVDRVTPEPVVTPASPAPQDVLRDAALRAAPQDEDGNPLHPEEDGASAASVTKGAPDASIAVLPFTDLSPGKDQEYFSDGMAEEILNVLAKVDGLTVAARTSSFAFKGQETLGIPAIAGELGVRHVLEGSVRKSGDTIRITAQLIDSTSDAHLWSETFDRKLTTENVFAIQDEIARAIVGALSSRISGADFSDPVSVTADTASIATLDLYYEANALFYQRGRENLIRAMALFEEITERDPDFARGWSGLSMIYAIAKSWGLPTRDYEPLARAAAARAIDLNPDLSSPYAALGQMEQEGAHRNWIAAQRNFDKAIGLDDRDPNVYNWRGLLWSRTGFADLAIADFRTCLEIDPAYVNCGYNLSEIFYLLGRIEEAVKIDKDLMRRGASDQLWAASRIQRLADSGDQYGVLAALNQMMLATIPDQRWIVGELFNAYFDPAFDRSAGFDRIISRLSAAGYKNFDETARDNIAFACRRYDDINFLSSFVEMVDLYPDFSKDELHRLFQRQGVPIFWRAHGFPPQCKPIPAKNGGKDDFECQ